MTRVVITLGKLGKMKGFYFRSEYQKERDVFEKLESYKFVVISFEIYDFLHTQSCMQLSVSIANFSCVHIICFAAKFDVIKKMHGSVLYETKNLS